MKVKESLKYFVGALIAGASLLGVWGRGLAPGNSLYLPVTEALIIIVYTTLLIRNLREEKRVPTDSEIESPYYLGFSFTLISMLFVLIDFNAGGNQDELKKMIPKFGVSLVGTVIGLLSKIIVTQIFEDGEESPLDVEIDEVTEAYGRLSVQIQASIEQIRDSTVLFQSQINQVAGNSGEKIDRYALAASERITGLFDQMQARINAFDLLPLSQQVGQFVREMNLNFEAAITVLNDNVQNNHKKMFELAYVNHSKFMAEFTLTAGNALKDGVSELSLLGKEQVIKAVQDQVKEYERIFEQLKQRALSFGTPEENLELRNSLLKLKANSTGTSEAIWDLGQSSNRLTQIIKKLQRVSALAEVIEERLKDESHSTLDKGEKTEDSGNQNPTEE
jgi:hypothetical protein